jgi:succinyl-CoA synthetase beta subunit
MKLHEYHSKQIFSRFGIPIPRGRVALTASEARQIAEELGSRVVIKSQVLVGGRGKAGGIRVAKDPKEAEDLATSILGMEIKGLKVHKVLVDEAITFDREIYLGITNDRINKSPVIIASATGGVDIEDTARNAPEKIVKVWINPMLGLRDYQGRELASGIDLPHSYWKSFIEITRGLWSAFQNLDATLAEINPLVVTQDAKLIALDAKINLDDNALYRHLDMNELRDLEAEDPSETEARKYGLAYVKMDGEIGCLVNGAGLAMTVMDMAKLHGGMPANFLDIGGGAGAEKVAAAMRIILSDPKVRVILVSIFGGITRCDEVSKGVLIAMREIQNNIPLVVRMVGTNASEGLTLLDELHPRVYESLNEASKVAVDMAKGVPA